VENQWNAVGGNIDLYGRNPQKMNLYHQRNRIIEKIVLKEMEHIKRIEKRRGVDVGYQQSNIHPMDREGCVGVSGIDKSYTFEMVLNLAYKMENRPNIIVKAGPNAKWYLKRYPIEVIEEEISKQEWRDTSHCIMYIIEWDE
jgi:hypothetical protein